MQETLLAVHLRRASYDRTQPFSAWVFAIARYKLIDHWRRRKVRATTPLGDVEEFLAAETVLPDDGLDLTRALASLPPRQRALVENVKMHRSQPQRGWGAGRGERGGGEGRAPPGVEASGREDAPCKRMS